MLHFCDHIHFTVLYKSYIVKIKLNIFDCHRLCNYECDLILKIYCFEYTQKCHVFRYKTTNSRIQSRLYTLNVSNGKK